MITIKPKDPIFLNETDCFSAGVVLAAKWDNGVILIGKRYVCGSFIDDVWRDKGIRQDPALTAFISRIEAECKPKVEIPMTRMEFQDMVVEMANATFSPVHAITKEAVLSVSEKHGYRFKEPQ